MAKFRKRPVVIEAWQWVPNEQADYNPQHWPSWLQDANARGDVFIAYGHRLHIDTLEGRMRVAVGDWIIRGVKGELYPCKPEIFEATYEPADNADVAPTVALPKPTPDQQEYLDRLQADAERPTDLSAVIP